MNRSIKIILLIATAVFVSSISVNAQQWVSLNSNTSDALLDINFPTPQVGYAVGYYGTIIKTDDAGTTWTSLNIGTNNTIKAVDFIDELKGFAAGDDGLFITTDGGLNWIPVTLSGSNMLYHVEVVDAQTVFCTGAQNHIYKSADAGTTWVQKPVTLMGQSINPVSDISFPTPLVGYAVMTSYNWGYLKTVDGGETWTEIGITPINNLTNMEAVHFTDENTGFLTGWYIAAFVQTGDGGSNWSESSLGSMDLWDVNFYNANNGIAVGMGGLVLLTNDGGQSWTSTIVHASNHVWYDVTFDDNGTAYLIGGGGVMYKNENPTGISTLQTEPEFDVYPNPSNSVFNVDFGDTQVQSAVISDVHGRIVTDLGQIYIQKFLVDLTAQTAGIYFLSITTDAGTRTVKLVKN